MSEMDSKKDRVAVTLNRDAYEKLAETKNKLKKAFGISYSYSDIINASLMLLNEEIFDKHNIKVVGLLSYFRDMRLLQEKMKKVEELQKRVGMIQEETHDNQK